MDLTPTGAEDAFRAECRAWLASTCRGSTARACRRASTTSPRRSRFGRELAGPLAEGRWVGVAWPERVRRTRRRAGGALRRAGGAGPGPGARAGRSHRRQPGRADAARPRHRRAEGAVAAGASSHADELWCQLFSEPDAGQRPGLASPRGPTPATAAGASTARRCGPATPSSPTGASAWPAPIPTRRSSRASPAFVVDMHAPGVEVRPLRQITGEAEFNEVFFDDVFVPDDQLIGPEHEGWRCRQLDPRPRAGHQPPPARHPHPAARGAAAAGRRADGALDDHRAPAAARRGLRRGAAVPAPQLALALAAGPGPRPRARRAARSSCTGPR